MRTRIWIGCGILLAVGGCASPDKAPGSSAGLERRLLGSWSGQNDARGAMEFTFDTDEHLTWVVYLPTGPDTLRGSYKAAASEGRLFVDLSGFETGPLAGLVLYGLVEFAGEDTLRLDVEPGPPGDDAPRPVALTSPDVMTLVRTNRD